MIIVIPYNSRLNYLKITLASLKEAMRNHPMPVILYNTAENSEDLEIFKEFNDIKILNHVRYHWHQIDVLLPKIIDDAMTNYADDYVILLDSDTLVHPLAIEKFKQMILDNSSLGIGTLFNTESHPFTSVINEIYGIKEVLGGFGWIIKKEAWNKYCKKVSEHWDVSASKNIANSGEYKNYCTINSYLEHIGFNGTHRNEKDLGHPMSIDRAKNFFN